MVTAHAEGWSTLRENMRWYSSNSDLNVEERKAYRMIQGFLPQNTQEGDLFMVVGANKGGRGLKYHGFSFYILS